MIEKTTQGLSSALSSAVKGLQKSEAVVARATDDLNAALVATQNSQAAANGRGEAVPVDGLAVDARAAEGAQTGDIVKPLVDILAAKSAYAANAAVVKVTADIEMDFIKRT